MQIANRKRKQLIKAALLCLTFSVFFVSGVLLHTISGRYFGYVVDYMYSTKTLEANAALKLKVRRMVHSLDETKDDDENDIYRENYFVNFNPETTGLLLIDVWDQSKHPNDGYARRFENHIKSQIKPLLNLARTNKLKVFHSPNEGVVSDHVKPLSGEWHLGWLHLLPQKLQTLYFYWLIKSKGITTLLIAGSGLHLCIWERPVGIDKLRHFRGLELILVRNATLTNEYENFEEEPMKKAFLNYLEADRLPSTTTDDLRSILPNS